VSGSEGANMAKKELLWFGHHCHARRLPTLPRKYVFKRFVTPKHTVKQYFSSNIIHTLSVTVRNVKE